MMAPNSPPPAMAEALALLWTRFLPEIEHRVNLVETAVQALACGSLHVEQREAAQEAAHKLAGTLGTFGLPRGTELARQAELYFAGENPSATADEVNAWVAELALIVHNRK